MTNPDYYPDTHHSATTDWRDDTAVSNDFTHCYASKICMCLGINIYSVYHQDVTKCLS